MSRMSAPIAVALVTAGCAAANPVPNAATDVVPAEAAAEATATPAAAANPTPVDIADINLIRCDPVTRTGSRIVVAERCYPVGRTPVNEEALAEQLEQVRRDQEDLDRRRREAEARRGPGL